MIGFLRKILAPKDPRPVFESVVESFYREHGKNPRAIWMSLETRARYVEALVNERRYVNTLRFDNGMEALELQPLRGGVGTAVALFVSRGVPDGILIATDSVDPQEIVVGL